MPCLLPRLAVAGQDRVRQGYVLVTGSERALNRAKNNSNVPVLNRKTKLGAGTMEDARAKPGSVGRGFAGIRLSLPLAACQTVDVETPI